MRILGIGDLHFDGKLSKYIQNLNEVIADELRTAVAYATRNGISVVILYGDICDKSTMTDDAKEHFLRVIAENSHLKFVVIPGNHDFKDNGSCSISLLHFMAAAKWIPNLKICLKPTVLFEKQGTPINLQPWPGQETRNDCLNVLHIEVKGATWETGRVTHSEYSTKHLCVIGHIHKAQTIGSMHFSGTLYQTSFGEPPEKFFHDINWTGDKKTSTVELVPHSPKYTLINYVVNKASDVDDIEDDPFKLYKVFVKKSVVLPDNVFLHKPNVVKTSNFATKAELKALMVEELILDDVSSEVSLRHEDVLRDWMTVNKIEEDLAKRALKKLKEMRHGH